MASDQVTLTVPARDEFARTVRMTAVALLGHTGVSIDLLDDVRIAVEEAYIYACEVGGCGERITFEFTLDENSLDILVGPLILAAGPEIGSEVLDHYSRFILEAVCDEFETRSDGSATFIRIRKRLGLS